MGVEVVVFHDLPKAFSPNGIKILEINEVMMKTALVCFSTSVLT